MVTVQGPDDMPRSAPPQPCGIVRSPNSDHESEGCFSPYTMRKSASSSTEKEVNNVGIDLIVIILDLIFPHFDLEDY